MEFYKSLRENNKILDAYTVIKNIMSRNPGDKEIFKEFVGFSLELAMYDMEFSTRKEYVVEANAALELFSERAEIDENVLELIKEARKGIEAVSKEIVAAEETFSSKILSEKRIQVGVQLGKLSDLHEMIVKAQSEEELNQHLLEVAAIEQSIDKESFSATQMQTYERLTQNYSKTISSKMDELNHKALLKYNKDAVNQFKTVFDIFTKNKKEYKSDEYELRSLLTMKLFVFDTSKLFNETLIYYNHVYNMIFQEVKDNLKFKMTEWALSTNKL